jgi:hypothetical protein
MEKKKEEGKSYKQQHVCVADTQATLMALGVVCWKSNAAPPWLRIDYNLNLLYVA